MDAQVKGPDGFDPRDPFSVLAFVRARLAAGEWTPELAETTLMSIDDDDLADAVDEMVTGSGWTPPEGDRLAADAARAADALAGAPETIRTAIADALRRV